MILFNTEILLHTTVDNFFTIFQESKGLTRNAEILYKFDLNLYFKKYNSISNIAVDKDKYVPKDNDED